MSDSQREQSGTSSLQERIQQLKGVWDCAVLRRASGNADVLVAYVVAGAGFSPERALRELSEMAPEQPIPDAWALVTALPRTPNGSIDEPHLRAIPVIDEALAARVEQEQSQEPGVARLVLFADDGARPAQALPLARLLNRTGPRAQTAPTSESRLSLKGSARLAAEAPAMRPPALQRGKKLALPPSAPRTLVESLEQAARTTHGAHITYLRDDGSVREQSFSELLAEAQRNACGLAQAGVTPGDAVLLQLPRAEQLLPVFWGCLLLGAVPANFAVPPNYTTDTSELTRLCKVIELLERPFVVGAPELVSELRTLASTLDVAPKRVLASKPLGDTQGEPPLFRAGEDDVAFLTFTSGSTGVPKGIELTHANVLSRARGTDVACGNDARDNVFNWLPFDHIGSISDWHLRCVELGCRMVYASKEYVLGDPLNWLRVMDLFRVTHSWAPNFAYGLVNAALSTADESWDLSCVKTLLSAGEAVSSSTVQEFARRLAAHGLPSTALRPAFGMAELASGVTYYRPSPEQPVRIAFVDRSSLDDELVELTAGDPNAIGFTSLGPIIPGASMRIVDDSNAVVPELRIGRLQIAGGPVLKGYYRNPSANQAVFTHDGWFDTGDRGFLNAGELYLTGRDKETLVINGANFYNGEVESAVEQVAGVVGSFTAACAVRAVGSCEEELAIFFVPARAQGAELAALLRRIQSAVVQKTGAKPQHLLPVTRSEIPKTAIGKIQRKQLTRRFENQEFAELSTRTSILLEGPDTLPDWFLTPTFQPKRATLPRASKPRSYWLIPDGYGLCELVSAELSRQGASYCIAPASDAASVSMLAGLALTDVLDLRGFAPDSERAAFEGAPTSTADLAAQELLALVEPIRVLASARGSEAKTVRYLRVGSHTARVHERDTLEPCRAMVPAFLRALAQELPHIACRHVDLTFTRDPEQLSAGAALLLQESRAIDAEPETAYRAGQRLVPGFERVRWPEAPGTNAIEAGGAYVISGGLGGVGSAIARCLLGRGDVTLLLIGRSTPTDDALTTLHELERTGRVHYAQADVCEPDSLEAAVAAFEQDIGRAVNGFFHLAATYHEAPCLDESQASLASLFRAKLDGALALSAVKSARPAAFVVHFSSLASVFGGSGVGAYAAANRFLDAHSALQRSYGVASYSINWSVWEGLGIGAGSVPNEVLRAKGLLPIASERGALSLLALLGRAPGAFLVGADVTHRALTRSTHHSVEPCAALRGALELSSRTPEAPLRTSVRDRFGTLAPLELWQLDAMPLDASGTPDRAAVLALLRGGSARERKPARSALEVSLLEIWKAVLSCQDIGVDDNFFDLGGTSLLAVRLFSEIEKRIGPSLTPATLFQSATIEALAAVLEQRTAPRIECLVELVESRASARLFFVHDTDGRVDRYRELAARLSSSCRVFGLLPYRRENHPAIHTRIAEMASYYAQQIIEQGSTGPLCIGGWGDSGLLAFEVACALSRAGQRVDLVALLDAPQPFADRPRRPSNSALASRLRRELGKASTRSELAKQIGDSLARKLQSQGQRAVDSARVRLLRHYGDRTRELPWYLQHIPATAVYRFAQASYRPSRFDGEVRLLRASRGDEAAPGELPLIERCRTPDFGWRDHAGRGVTLVDVAGGHESMRDAPHVASTADALLDAVHQIANVRRAAS